MVKTVCECSTLQTHQLLQNLSGTTYHLTYELLLSFALEMSETSEKMHKLDHHVAVAVAGLNSDANTLINASRLFAQR